MKHLSVFGMATLTEDPTIKAVNKTHACHCSIVFQNSYKDKNGKWQEDPCFITAELWGASAEKFAELRKGDPVFISGQLIQKKWEDKDGRKRTAHAIKVGEWMPGLKRESKQRDDRNDRGDRDDRGGRGNRGNDRDDDRGSSRQDDGPPPDDADDSVPF